MAVRKNMEGICEPVWGRECRAIVAGEVCGGSFDYAAAQLRSG